MIMIGQEKQRKGQKKAEELRVMRHSAAHVLAQAVMRLFPDTKLGIGPAIENGFYYDFEFSRPVNDTDLAAIEAEMEKIKKENLFFEKSEKTIADAKKWGTGKPYKLELIEDLDKTGEEKVTFYNTGEEFVDLCKGPHVASTGKIGLFKLLNTAGAYWKGDEKGTMMTRIYGTSWQAKDDLDKYVQRMEEAKKRDHRKLGAELKLWTFSDKVGSGLPLFTHKGALVRRLICEFVEELQCRQGIAQVWTPQIAKAELFKISGHYDKYRKNMFRVESNYSEEEFYLKPMNCPQHTQIYASEMRSYRDLPIRMADFAMLYRDEKPGELLGLARTRSFSQDDCHIFCREDQVEEEMKKALEMTEEIMKTYGFSYKYRLSLRDPKKPEKYLGDEALWEKGEKLSKKVIEDRGAEYFEGVGEAAFYAPKLDLIVTDSLGREWQLSTLQIDFFMPERFDLTYVDTDGSLKRPVMLHRAISGSPERLIAILLEHFGGALPVWLSPVQVKVIPITDGQNGYARGVLAKLKDANVRSEMDDRNETMQSKIRDAQLEKVPYMLIIGKREEMSGMVAKRGRSGKDYGQISIEDFIGNLKKEIETKSLA